MFEQFKENISLAREFARKVRDGLRSAPEAWRKATPEKRSIWLSVPSVIVVSAIADHFSAPWYYQLAVLVLAVVLVGVGLKMRDAMRRKLP